jgi:hypothetical protein
VGTKLDATTDRARLDRLRAYCREHSLEFHAISSVTGEGIQTLVRAIANALDRLAPRASFPEQDSMTDTGKSSGAAVPIPEGP